MGINNYKNDVFELLSKGNFICSNSSEPQRQRLYNYIEDHFDALASYFKEINYILTQGVEYFYFTRHEQKADITRKLEQAFRWIDILDLFKTYDPSFGSGYRFTPSEITVELKRNATLRNKLSSLKKYTKSEKELEKIGDLIKSLEKEGFVELEDATTDAYKVLSSFSYLENLVLSINLSEEVQNEIPK
ncbi:hypothetical protein K4L44_03935 [Halosquirtibacter laminarini]|uniref:Uncharacterized protein n=1 Tax=Halosquirtibacter laminarini TaxID=3374600 RepID=A0AC61NNN8_9BACT|nr:hypothetical protein K4L44_03935 [Prolixibacteraceae bacterium]